MSHGYREKLTEKHLWHDVHVENKWNVGSNPILLSSKLWLPLARRSNSANVLSGHVRLPSPEGGVEREVMGKKNKTNCSEKKHFIE